MFLLLLFMGYYGSITLFPHSHIVNGDLVTHSHPYSSSNHSHSASQLQQLSSLTNFQTIQGTPCAIPDPILIPSEQESVCIQKDWRKVRPPFVSLRAPPVSANPLV